jgi:uncharacterized membrane protein YbhN (UPF0104 family)
MAALAVINSSTLRLCQVTLGRRENFLLTAYTAIINFFGPLQSGPAFRVVYLKKRYKVNLKNYAMATFVYYFFYAAYSGLFLLSGLLRWWLLVVVALGVVAVVSLPRVAWFKPRLAKLDLRGWYYLAFSTLLQVCLVAAIYYTELHSVAPGVRLSQAIIYTGAANFALFVSITPAAIGIRESFLVLSQHLHHNGNATIVTANILDRATYILVLLLMAVFILVTHARRQLSLTSEED